ncbi:MAG: superinfection immunity protein [Rhodospirillales bacterium]|nr:superinfection immunity protein [Rhodospirillales bacterium]
MELAFLLALLAVIYFVPTVVAAGRAHHQTLAIFMLNLFLGWTFLGWVLALVWACTAVRAKNRADLSA